VSPSRFSTRSTLPSLMKNILPAVTPCSISVSPASSERSAPDASKMRSTNSCIDLSLAASRWPASAFFLATDLLL